MLPFDSDPNGFRTQTRRYFAKNIEDGDQAIPIV